jgi:hypothetical protein
VPSDLPRTTASSLELIQFLLQPDFLRETRSSVRALRNAHQCRTVKLLSDVRPALLCGPAFHPRAATIYFGDRRNQRAMAKIDPKDLSHLLGLCLIDHQACLTLGHVSLRRTGNLIGQAMDT